MHKSKAESVSEDERRYGLAFAYTHTQPTPLNRMGGCCLLVNFQQTKHRTWLFAIKTEPFFGQPEHDFAAHRRKVSGTERKVNLFRIGWLGLQDSLGEMIQAWFSKMSYGCKIG